MVSLNVLPFFLPRPLENETTFNIQCFQKWGPVCMAAVEELQVQLSRFLHIFIDQASTESLRPFSSQSDRLLLIYG